MQKATTLLATAGMIAQDMTSREEARTIQSAPPAHPPRRNSWERAASLRKKRRAIARQPKRKNWRRRQSTP